MKPAGAYPDIELVDAYPDFKRAGASLDIKPTVAYLPV